MRERRASANVSPLAAQCRKQQHCRAETTLCAGNCIGPVRRAWPREPTRAAPSDAATKQLTPDPWRGDQHRHKSTCPVPHSKTSWQKTLGAREMATARAEPQRERPITSPNVAPKADRIFEELSSGVIKTRICHHGGRCRSAGHLLSKGSEKRYYTTEKKRENKKRNNKTKK